MGKKVKERVISQDEYFARIGQGVPIGDCWIDVGNGEYAYALQEVVVVGVPFNKYGDKSFAVQHISALAIADNTRVDTRQRDVKIRVAENAIEADRTKKELVAKVKNIVNKYYDNEIKQFPEQEVLLVSQKLRFNREIITKDNFYHYDFPKKLMSGVNGEIIKKLITISEGNFTDENPYHRQTYLSTYEPSGLEKWGDSENIFAKFSYSLVNDAYVLLQIFSFDLVNKLWDRGERINELTGGKAWINLDGSTNYSAIDNLVDIIPMVVSSGASSAMKSIPHGFGYLSKFNAAQFSQLISKLPSSLKSAIYKPKIRGVLNKGANKAIHYWNNQISNGMVIFKVKSLRPKENIHFDNDNIPNNH